MVKLHLAMARVESTDERDEKELLREHREFCDLVLARETARAQENLLKGLIEAEKLVLSSSFVADQGLAHSAAALRRLILSTGRCDTTARRFDAWT